jgi:hypothetical protein
MSNQSKTLLAALLKGLYYSTGATEGLGLIQRLLYRAHVQTELACFATSLYSQLC